MTSWHKTGAHPFYIGMYIHIYTHIYVHKYASQKECLHIFSGLGCVAFCVHVLGPVPSPLGVSDLSLRHAAGEGFLLGLRPDLGGVWMF